MITLFMVVGAVTLLAFSVAALIAAWGYLTESQAKAHWEQDQRLKREVIRDLGATLVSQCYWFTESDDAWFAIMALGEKLRDTGDFDVSEVRDLWRQKLTGESAPVNAS